MLSQFKISSVWVLWKQGYACTYSIILKCLSYTPCASCSLMSDSLRPHGLLCNLPGSSAPGIFQARVLNWAAISLSGDLPNLGIQPRSPALQAGSLPSEPPGKPDPRGYWV